MKPTYAEFLIVGIIVEKVFRWYIFDEEWCYLDAVKRVEVFREYGYQVPEEENFRLGIDILNENSIRLFIDKADKFRITTQELRNMYLDEKIDRLSYIPAVLINFDSKVLMNYYIECQPFENYVPVGWKGVYENFIDKIPYEERFWIDKDGNDIMFQE